MNENEEVWLKSCNQQKNHPFLIWVVYCVFGCWACMKAWKQPIRHRQENVRNGTWLFFFLLDSIDGYELEKYGNGRRSING